LHVLRADTYLGYPQLYPNDRIQEQVQALEFEQALPNMWIRFECDVCIERVFAAMMHLVDELFAFRAWRALPKCVDRSIS
jgi:hypothetical protein